MDANDAQRIVLTRAIEETLPDAVSPEMQIDALHAAGAVKDEVGWIARRSRFLIGEPLAAYQPLLALTQALGSLGGLVLAAGFAAGLLVDYLGPSQQIHALYNPICVLIVWNVGAFLVLIARALVGLARPKRGLRRESGEEEPTGDAAATIDSHRSPQRVLGPGVIGRWWLRRWVPTLWLRFNRAASDARGEAEDFSRVVRAFWSLWIPVAGPLFALRARRLLNFGG